jgi:hypothetical protein
LAFSVRVPQRAMARTPPTRGIVIGTRPAKSCPSLLPPTRTADEGAGQHDSGVVHEQGDVVASLCQVGHMLGISDLERYRRDARFAHHGRVARRSIDLCRAPGDQLTSVYSAQSAVGTGNETNRTVDLHDVLTPPSNSNLISFVIRC